VKTINGTHLPLPETSASSSTKVCLQHLQSLNVVYGEVDVVEADVDGINCFPDALENLHLAHAIDETEIERVPSRKIAQGNSQACGKFYRMA
jgi:hypothetical protein